MSRREELTDEQWALIEPLIPPLPRRADGRGRPIRHGDRAVLNGVLWVLRTGAAWADLPERFPCRLNLLSPVQPLGQGRGAAQDSGNTGPALRGARPDQSRRMLYRRYFLSSKKRGQKVGKTKRGKGTKLMVIADAHGLPLALHPALAHPHEVTLIEPALNETLTLGRPRRLIGDRADARDPLDQRLAAQGICLIAPHRRNRIQPGTQDGRALRRYRRRWKIERLFAWLNKFKRVLTRWDRCHKRFTASSSSPSQ